MSEKIDNKLWWTSRCTKDLWCESDPGVCGSMYFPYTEQFMKKCPWLAVRVFYYMLQLRIAWLDLCKIYPRIIL